MKTISPRSAAEIVEARPVVHKMLSVNRLSGLKLNEARLLRRLLIQVPRDFELFKYCSIQGYIRRGLRDLAEKIRVITEEYPGGKLAGCPKESSGVPRLLFGQKWAYAFDQEFVAFGVKVEFVSHKQLRARLTIAAEGDGP